MTAHRRRHTVVQTLRRCSQAAATILLVALIFLGLYYNYYASRSLEEIRSIEGWRGTVLSFIDDRMIDVRDPEGFLRANTGNLWSMRLAGVEIADPLAFAEATAASKKVHWPLLLAILPPLLVTFLLGRVFCSWICPGYVVFELAGGVRTGLERLGLRLPEVRFAHANKYLLLAVGLAIAAATSLPIFSLFYPPALLSRAAHAFIFGTGVAGMLSLMGLLVAFEVFVSPRWWCRTMCPGGALYGLVGARRALRVRLVLGRCTNCRLCEPACEAGLNPIKESSTVECDNCGACVRDCPDQALAFSLELPGRAGRAGPKRRTPRVGAVAQVEPV